MVYKVNDSNGWVTNGLSGASESIFIKIRIEGRVNQIALWDNENIFDASSFTEIFVM